MTSDYKKLWDIKLHLDHLTTDDLACMNFIEQFSDFTRTMIVQGKMDIAQRCFKLAEKTFVKGSKGFKTIFTNTFFYSLSITIAYSHCENIIPTLLQKELHSFEMISIRSRAENIDEL